MRIRIVVTILISLFLSLQFLSISAAQESKDSSESANIGISLRVIMSNPIDEDLLGIVRNDVNVLQRALKRVEPTPKSPGPQVRSISDVRINHAGVVGGRELSWLSVDLVVSKASLKELLLKDNEWRKNGWEDIVTKVVTTELEETYNRIYRDIVVKDIQKQLEEASAKVDNARARQVELESQIEHHERSMGLPQSVAEELLKNSLQQKHELTMDTLAAKARSKALSREMERLQAVTQITAKEDPVVQQLAKLVKLAEDHFSKTKTLIKAGTSPMSELHKAEAELIKARVEYERARREAAVSSGSDYLNRMSEELSSLTVEIATVEARAEAENKSIQRLDRVVGDNLKAQRDIDRLRREIPSVQSRVKSLSRLEDALKRQLEEQKPLSITPWKP